MIYCFVFFFSSRRRHTRLQGDWSSDVCSSDLSSSWASCWAKWCSRDLTTTQLNARNTKVVAMPSRAVTLNASDAGRLRRGLWREVIIRRIERVSHATYSVDELWIERIVDLCAQTTDGHINDVAVAVEIHVPYLRRNQRTRQNFTLSRSEEHTSELQSPCNLVCRLLLEQKKNADLFI